MPTFPPVRSIIGLAYQGADITLVTGSSYNAITNPLSKLLDNAGRSVWRAAEGTVAIRFDLGANTDISFFGICNHNIDSDILCSVHASSTASTLDMPPFALDDEYTNDWVATQVLSRAFSARQPCCWVDTRDANGNPTNARYWQLHIAGNSRPLVLGEVVYGEGSEFTGVIKLPYSEDIQSPQKRHEFEYGGLTIAGSGALLRAMELSLVLTADEVTALQNIDLQAVTGGGPTRVVVIPDTRRNDLWHVEWSSIRDYTYPVSDREVETTLSMVEEAFGVV